MRVLDKPQAEIDLAQAEGVAKLISALDSSPNAFVQIGSVFLIKVDGVIAVRNLSQRELAFLKCNSRILASPRAILEALEEFAKGDSSADKPIDFPGIMAAGESGEVELPVLVPASNEQVAETITIEDGTVRLIVSSPDDCGHVGVVLDDGLGTISKYDVSFDHRNGSPSSMVERIGAIQIQADPDGKPVLREKHPILIAKRSVSNPQAIEMMLGLRKQHTPKTYTLEFKSIAFTEKSNS